MPRSNMQPHSTDPTRSHQPLTLPRPLSRSLPCTLPFSRALEAVHTPHPPPQHSLRNGIGMVSFVVLVGLFTVMA